MTDFQAARASLIKKLGAEIDDKKVLAAMARVPREMFVPPESISLAYEDQPLPIGCGQTISQPYIIALMTQAIELTGNEKVLELGTGSGYQTAILAELAGRVVTIERIPELADAARKVLADLGYTNIETHLAGEDLGWPPGAPYDAILVTAGAPEIPCVLLDQLTEGGRLVIPVGNRYLQELNKVIKHKDGNLIRNLGGCRFVSLIGKNAWDSEIIGGQKWTF
jgi:protein-L-isoaspartate(D-aspartate) O-methyltransferase